MHRLSFRLFALPALMLALAACNHSPPPVAQPSAPPADATPDGAVRANLALTRDGDFDGLLRSTLPPSDYQAWRNEWQRARAQQPAVTPAQRAQFASMMQKLTAPDAEDKLLKPVQLQMAQLRAHRAQNLPMLIGILQAAGNDLVQKAVLSPEQKQQATQAMAALAAWAQGADFTDEGKARQAIALICLTARKLDIQTLDQWRALSYPQVMARYAIGWSGLKQLETLSNDGKRARVRETVILAGKPIISEVQLMKQDGHWYDAAKLTAWRGQDQKPAAAAAAAPSSNPSAKPVAAPAR